MIQFILNNQLVETPLPGGSTVLDFVRYHKRLTGTKIGCREGDCGACTILVGDFENEKLIYRNMTSCLMPLINASGKHIVTVEGINMNGLSPVQQALVDTNGTQCGFCTTGFVMSLTGFVLHRHSKKQEEAVVAMDGNICRCTGYKSIERAAQLLADQLTGKPEEETIPWLVKNNFIPDYFLDTSSRLKELNYSISKSIPKPQKKDDTLLIAGGTDLIVQKHHAVKKSAVNHLLDDFSLKEIKRTGAFCYVGGAVTITAFSESEIIKNLFPGLEDYIRLISSTPIRNMATMGGNLVNASPIGDMSIFFLALGSELIITENGKSRKVKLRDFYKAYKQIDKNPNEVVEKIVFKIPSPDSHFNFEKVSKRSWLDIASVNSACLLTFGADKTVEDIHLSAGGVAPFPKFLTKTSDFLRGKKIVTETILEAIQMMYSEITPISDARGTAAYKKLLLRQLFIAHLVKFFGMTEGIKKLLLK